MGSSKTINGLVVTALVIALLVGAALPAIAEGPDQFDPDQVAATAIGVTGLDVMREGPAVLPVTGLDDETRDALVTAGYVIIVTVPTIRVEDARDIDEAVARAIGFLGFAEDRTTGADTYDPWVVNAALAIGTTDGEHPYEIGLGLLAVSVGPTVSASEVLPHESTAEILGYAAGYVDPLSLEDPR